MLLLLAKWKARSTQELPVIVTNQCGLESLGFPGLVDTATSHDAGAGGDAVESKTNTTIVLARLRDEDETRQDET